MGQRKMQALQADLCCPDNWLLQVGHDDGPFEDICGQRCHRSQASTITDVKVEIVWSCDRNTACCCRHEAPRNLLPRPSNTGDPLKSCIII